MDEIAFLRDTFDGKGTAPLGWDAVHAFEAKHGIVLPEPYRTFVAEIADGAPAGPPEYGLVALADLPRDWGADRSERALDRPFPLTATWSWDEAPARRTGSSRCWSRSSTTGRSCSAPTAAA
ncbi:SMI1/KNR4 family protein [Actinosynnema sp. NPDC047251]|nr:SMI1/KNR4 family protein [Saccharothrix espanaensis]